MFSVRINLLIAKMVEQWLIVIIYFNKKLNIIGKLIPYANTPTALIQFYHIDG